MQCTAGSLGVPGQGHSCLEEGTLPAHSFHLPLQIHSPPSALLCGLEGWPRWTASLTPNFWLGSPSGRCWQEIGGERICFSWLPCTSPGPPPPQPRAVPQLAIVSISSFAERHSSHSYCWLLSKGFSPFAPQTWVLTAHCRQHQGTVCHMVLCGFP